MSRFTLKTPKNRLPGVFLPCKARKDPAAGGSRLLAALTLLGLFLFSPAPFSCSPKPVSPESGALAVQAAPAGLRALRDSLSSFGTITYRIKNDITVQVEGTIASLYVKEGDEVKAGQPLARLRNLDLETRREQYENALDAAGARLNAARADMREARLAVEARLISVEKGEQSLVQQELEFAEAAESLEKQRKLLSLGGLTSAAFRSMEVSLSAREAGIAVLKKDIEITRLGLRDEDLRAAGFELSPDPAERIRQFAELNTRAAAAELEGAEAELRSAEKNLESVKRLIGELTVRSTVSGIVGALYFENGEYVPQNGKLATLMDTSGVFALFYIQEQDMIRFPPGAAAEVEIPSLGLRVQAKLDEISPVADPQSGNFAVKASLSNPDLRIKPGMFIRCSIPVTEELLLPAIPETALLTDKGGRDYVFCAVKGAALIKTVKLRSRRDGMLWIEEGLAEGDMVIDKPSPFLKEGASVEYR
ncbi:MAG: efflux RND transporter periplasmic adaptor subunit [Treponema sp.]|nr:efflux RND transporter periplasmic adaptor subunit [Treponema sp.]